MFGIALAVLTSQIKLVQVQYDNQCGTPSQNPTCTITVTFTETLSNPVYFYYELDNFYQNHRTYLNSKDLPQLKGEIRTVDQLSSCDPVVTVGDLYSFQKKNLAGIVLPDTAPANPCGLIAKSFFNGTVSVENMDINLL